MVGPDTFMRSPASLNVVVSWSVFPSSLDLLTLSAAIFTYSIVTSPPAVERPIVNWNVVRGTSSRGEQVNITGRRETHIPLCRIPVSLYYVKFSSRSKISRGHLPIGTTMPEISPNRASDNRRDPWDQHLPFMSMGLSSLLYHERSSKEAVANRAHIPSELPYPTHTLLGWRRLTNSAPVRERTPQRLDIRRPKPYSPLGFRHNVNFQVF